MTHTTEMSIGRMRPWRGTATPSSQGDASAQLSFRSKNREWLGEGVVEGLDGSSRGVSRKMGQSTSTASHAIHINNVSPNESQNEPRQAITSGMTAATTSSNKMNVNARASSTSKPDGVLTMVSWNATVVWGVGQLLD